jgi:hypothetical protein
MSICPPGSEQRLFYGAILFCLLFDAAAFFYYLTYKKLLAKRVLMHATKSQYLEQNETKELCSVNINDGSVNDDGSSNGGTTPVRPSVVNRLLATEPFYKQLADEGGVTVLAEGFKKAKGASPVKVHSLCTHYTLAMHSLCTRYALTMH